MDKIIKDIEKCSGGSEILRVSFNEFKDSKFLSLRYWYNSSDGKEPRFLPTRKGVAIQFHLLPALIEALEKAVKEVEVWEKGVNDEKD